MSTMKQNTGSARLAGLMFGILALLSSASAAAFPGSADAERRLITTQGRGEVRVRPDSTRIDLGVETRAVVLEQARDEANRRMQRVQEALRRLQIPGLTLQTRALELSPIHEAPQGDALPKIIGYRVVNSISATVLRALPDELGAYASRIVDAAQQAGTNVVSGISFFVKNVREAQDQALSAAVADAERNARAMARAARVPFGKLYSIEGSPAFQGDFALRAFEAAAPAATPIATGERVISSSVSARFTFGRK